MPHTPPRHLAEGPRVGIRHFSHADAAEFTARARQSKDLHHPWLFPPESVQAYEAYAARLIEDRTKAGFLVCEKDTEATDGAGGPAGPVPDGGSIAGFVNINNIVEGGFLSGALGYGAFAHAAGRGLMREGWTSWCGTRSGRCGCTGWRSTSSRATPPRSPWPAPAVSTWRASRRGCSTSTAPGATTSAGRSPPRP